MPHRLQTVERALRTSLFALPMMRSDSEELRRCHVCDSVMSVTRWQRPGRQFPSLSQAGEPLICVVLGERYDYPVEQLARALEGAVEEIEPMLTLLFFLSFLSLRTQPPRLAVPKLAYAARPGLRILCVLFRRRFAFRSPHGLLFHNLARVEKPDSRERDSPETMEHSDRSKIDYHVLVGIWLSVQREHLSISEFWTETLRRWLNAYPETEETTVFRRTPGSFSFPLGTKTYQRTPHGHGRKARRRRGPESVSWLRPIDIRAVLRF